MANAPIATHPPPAQPVRSHRLLRIIAIAILSLIVLIGLAILIAWLIIRPKQITYSIDTGSVSNFNLHNNHLNASFDFLIRAHNPNRRISIYYDSIDVSVSYDDQTIAFNTLEPFYQPRHNVTQVEAKVEARNVALSSGLAKDLSVEKSSGRVEIDVLIKARIRFKVGVLKMRHRSLRVLCPYVPVHFPSNKISQRVYCDIDY
ncbi:Late embryogenesis abundant (LEA) hydroxyproline-rich glycoprotein family [Euphorbia peplus]|nr:Late embryogenesis abundant (LEA) hydroxyproline-rich glycoprotein family [Euphorbia peplus]